MEDTPYNGEVRVHEGVTYTWNGRSWSYEIRQFPENVITLATYAGFIPKPEVNTRNVDVEAIYDWFVMQGLATGRLYAQEVQVSN